MYSKKFDNEVSDLSEMWKILKTELESKERSILLGNPSDRNNHHNKYSSAALYSHSKSIPKKCIFCDENHSANKCSKITDPHARKSFLAGNGRCSICFQSKHLGSARKSNYKCH